MGSNRLVMTLLLSLSLIHLSACKEDNGNRTTVRKGNVDRKGTGAKKPEDPQGKNTGSDDKKADGSRSGDGPASSTTSDTDCEEFKKKAKNLGWKSYHVEVKEGTQLHKINYFIYEKSESDIKDPVIYFKRSSFQKATEQDLNFLTTLYSQHNLDPIIMDMRGSGCSSALPDLKTKTAELQKYGSSAAVSDAEAIRVKILKDKKWKVMAHQSGGVVALRYAQNKPEGISSIHIADFAPVKNQAELMKMRMAKEETAWKALMKETNLEQAVVDKALKNLESEKCTVPAKCQELVDVLSYRLSNKDQWDYIANTIKKISDSQIKSEDLLKDFQMIKSMKEMNIISRILDIDSDKNLSACSEALKTSDKNVLNSCRLEKNIGLQSSVSTYKVLNHESLNLTQIKSNLSQHKINYYLFAGNHSTTYPMDAYEQHETEFDSEIKDFEKIDSEGSEVYKNDSFLKTLKAP